MRRVVMNRFGRMAERVAARDENARMRQWLDRQGVDARVKYIWTGSLKGRWRLFNPNVRWTQELADKLNGLGFRDFDGKPLHGFSGNGGVFSVFVRGHEEMLDGGAAVAGWRDRVAAGMMSIADLQREVDSLARVAPSPVSDPEEYADAVRTGITICSNFIRENGGRRRGTGGTRMSR